MQNLTHPAIGAHSPSSATTATASPSTETVIAILTLILGLVTVAVGIAQLYQFRARKHRQPDPESAHTGFVMSVTLRPDFGANSVSTVGLPGKSKAFMMLL